MSALQQSQASDPADARRIALRDIIIARSFKRGEDIQLASGRSSSFYFDMKATMLHPKGAALIAELMLDAAEPFEPDYVGGLEMGAVPIVCAASAASDRRDKPIAAFFVRKTAKGHGTQALIEGLAPDEDLTGRRVVIVEDVTTTGNSALKAVAAAEAEGATVVAVLTIVDRLEGAVDTMAGEGHPFVALFQADEFA